jgi:anti-sigma B factor antagonist
MSHLRIEHRTNGQVAILDLFGRLTMGEGSGTRREGVRRVLAEGHKDILINMRDVGYVDSSGLGELISAFSTARR